jgi:CheY-like chemotaxis protein
MPRVLVVDDDLGTRQTCEVILRGAGLEVETAPCGRGALASLQRVRCELLFVDLKLPDIDGLEVLASLRRRGLAVPAVVMTGYPSVETAAQAIRLGVVEYLVKPVFDDDIRAAVWRALRQRVAGGGAQSDMHLNAAPDLNSGEAAAGPAHRIEEGAPMPDGQTRWAQAMTAAIHAPEDVTTIEAWAELVRPYAAPATLRGWCRAADLSAKGSLDEEVLWQQHLRGGWFQSRWPH